MKIALILKSIYQSFDSNKWSNNIFLDSRNWSLLRNMETDLFWLCMILKLTRGGKFFVVRSLKVRKWSLLRFLTTRSTCWRREVVQTSNWFTSSGRRGKWSPRPRRWQTRLETSRKSASIPRIMTLFASLERAHLECVDWLRVSKSSWCNI